jgi:REP-associated tyrosine transposase
MKPGTFTQMYVQIVFAVKNREALLTKPIQEQVFPYIGGVIKNLKNKSILVNGVTNHIHILLGLNPNISVSDIVYHVKRNSSLYINTEKLCPGHFSWQEGYGAFTYSRSQLDNVYKYIANQEQHHKEESFREEYMSILATNEIEFDTKYLFDFFDKD